MKTSTPVKSAVKHAVKPAKPATNSVELCDEEELMYALTKLAACFATDHLTPGCRIAIALNIIEAAMDGVTGADRLEMNDHICGTIIFGREYGRNVPRPNVSEFSLAVH